MSELGNTLKQLRGDRSQAAVADACGLHARTILRAESGDEVRLDTLRRLSEYFGLTRQQFAQLLVAWVRLELGDDFQLLDVRPKGKATPLTDTEKFLEIYRAIPARWQRELRRAAEREEVLRSIAPLNDLYDSLRATR